MTRWVYGFGGGDNDGRAEMKNLLGGKGANLAEMASIGLPVPPGFTITTEVCTAFYENDRRYPDDLRRRSIPRWRGSSARPGKVRRRRKIRCWSRCAPARGCRCRA